MNSPRLRINNMDALDDKVYRILVAEDDPDDRQIVLSAIKGHPIKCEVKLVVDGAELLNYLADITLLPDVLLLDISMPKIDGLEALKIIKEDERLKNIPVYIISISNDDTHRRVAKLLGAEKYYLKTPHYKDIVAIVTEVCNDCMA